jgi:signal peptidase II
MERRKNRLINKRFQYKYALILTGITALAFLMFVIPTIIILNNNYNLFLNSGVSIAPDLVETLDVERQLLFIGFFALFFICSITLFIVGITLTHKIAGPVFAFERCIQNIIHGKFNTELNLRENDELQELSLIFSEFKEFLVNKEKDELVILKEVLKDKSGNATKLEELIKSKESRLTSC